MLAAAGCGLGCRALWRGKPESWTDVVADDAAVRRVAVGLLAFGVVLRIAGSGTMLGLPGASAAGGIALLLSVAAAIVGNHALFGDLRPLHAGTNVVVAALVLWLLWVGARGQISSGVQDRWPEAWVLDAIEVEAHVDWHTTIQSTE